MTLATRVPARTLVRIVALALLAPIWFACSDGPGTPPAGSTGPDLSAAVSGPERALQARELGPALRAQGRHSERLLRAPEVVGTAVGVDDRGRPAVKIYTTRAGVRNLPRELDGVPVVIEVTGPIVALQEARKRCPKNAGRSASPNHACDGGGGGGEPVDPTSRFPRPVPIGVSTGHPSITAGTIGARVTDGAHVYALSNNHVYAVENQASVGDAVIQPGTFDGGQSPADDIGTLADFEPIVFSTTANNVIDAAIARSTTELLGNATPSDGYGLPRSTPVPPAVRMRVMKYGRTTGQTSGRIDAINATVNVGYGSGVARFVGQIVIKPGSFSAGGDSGSLIVVQRGGDARKPVGLLFAGSTLVTIANPIGAVLDRFGVSIDGE